MPATPAQALTALERALDRRIGSFLRDRPGWAVTVVPYVGHGSGERVHVRGRVVARRRKAPRRHAGPAAVFLTGVSHYLSAEVAGEPVEVALGSSSVQATSDAEGYVEAELTDPGIGAGWHTLTFRPKTGDAVTGRAVVVDPQASLGIISDIDDTVIHTGLSSLREALRNTLLVAEELREPLAGGAALYAGLVAHDSGRAPTFYVSTGAWNLQTVLEEFLDRHRFPPGPMLMTDWGPGGRWVFRENSIAFKSRTILDLVDEHPGLRWVLVGDSGQHDPEAYATVARARPDRLRAVYIREVPGGTPARASQVHAIADELGSRGTPMLLMPDSIAIAEHAAALGLLDVAQVEQVRRAVLGASGER